MMLLYRAAQRFEARFRSGGCVILTGEPHYLCNWMVVMEGGFEGSATLREYVALLRERSVSGLVYMPPEVDRALTPMCDELGLEVPGPVPLMVRPAGPIGSPIDDRFSVERVQGEVMFEAAASVIADAFGMPRELAWRCFGAGSSRLPYLEWYVAVREGTVWSSVAITRCNDLVYVGVMGTDPYRARQGAGRVLLTEVMREHQRRGAEGFYLIASDQGKGLYEQLGFATKLNGITRLVEPNQAEQPLGS
jgi:hypothetical protein